MSINEAELVVEPSDSDDLTTDEEDDESAKQYQLLSQCAEPAAWQEETQELEDDLTTDEGEDESAIQYQPLSQCQRELDVKEQWKLQGRGVVALMGVSPEEITMVNSIKTMPIEKL